MRAPRPQGDDPADEDYVTVTVVLYRGEDRDSPLDQLLEGRDDVRWFGVSDGVSDVALAGGADSSTWPENEPDDVALAGGSYPTLHERVLRDWAEHRRLHS